MNYLSMYIFHLKIFAKNRYFLSLMTFSTLSLVLMQYIIAYSTDSLSDTTIWIRAGIFGMWGTTITAAGIITFQKFMGTLPYILNGKVSEFQSISALILPCSSFGLLAFPVSYIACFILGIEVTVISFEMIVALLFLYTGAVSYSLFIAPMFVLTRNAILYEQVINIPILLISGIFSIDFISENVLNVTQYINPLTAPIRYLMGYSEELIIPSIVAQVIWFSMAYIAGSYILKQVKQSGKIEVL